ncbi:hypothetical protein F5051DRAFT_444990 [Lentinula edodes]|nr:hypothetical protein F5051DRAFT_444990 [Lentinula edodes]
MPRVDSQYDCQSHILHYNVELPGVQRQHLKVITAYSSIFKERNLVVWGMSLAPNWHVPRKFGLCVHENSLAPPRLSPPVDLQRSSREFHGYIAAPYDMMSAPLQATMERAHGEFYRVLRIPAKTQLCDIIAVLSNGILSFTIRCDKPLMQDEIPAAQEMVEETVEVH